VYFGSTECKTKKGRLICWDDPAFIRVDPELETLFKEAFQASHYPLSRSLTLYQNDEVISIAGKPVSSFLQLFVQIIQNDVGQQWRQRPALWNSQWGFLQTALYHYPGPQVFSDKA
jgi:hypothetical protein